jgi:hypothetical protein
MSPISRDPEFKAYEVQITRGKHRGQTAKVVGDMTVWENDLPTNKRKLTCKLADGTFAMIPESSTRRTA